MIFVIDSSNRESLNEAHTEFVKLLSEKELKDAVILILANKQVNDALRQSDLNKKVFSFFFKQRKKFE